MSEEMKGFIESKLESERLSLVTIRGGAAVEMFDRQLDRVMQNIADINTDKKPRKIIVEVAIAPVDDARSMVAFAINVPPAKLSGQEPVQGFADVRVDPNGRGVFARAKDDPQMAIPFPTNVQPLRKE